MENMELNTDTEGIQRMELDTTRTDMRVTDMNPVDIINSAIASRAR